MIPLFIAGALTVFLSYHLACGARKPMFIGGKGPLRSILNIVSTKTGVYCPTVWSFGGHLHTVFGNILKSRPRVNYTGEHLKTPDGGELRLDWTTSDEGGTQENAKDIVLILPGITGNSHEKYALHFVEIAKNLRCRAVVLNYRGIGTPLMTYRASCGANTDDLEFVLRHLRESSPRSRVCVVGVSLGGIIVTNYLVKMASTDQSSSLLAAFVVSVPWDLFVSCRSFEKPLTWLLFNRFLTRKLQAIFAVNYQALKAREVEVPKDVDLAAAKANTIRQFDDAVTAPMFGYRDVDDYYTAASITHKSFESIKTPLLCLNAADDPFSPYEQIPVQRIENCENVALILTHTGGHVGFLEGFSPTGQGYMGRVYKEYIKAVFEQL